MSVRRFEFDGDFERYYDSEGEGTGLKPVVLASDFDAQAREVERLTAANKDCVAWFEAARADYERLLEALERIRREVDCESDEMSMNDALDNAHQIATNELRRAALAAGGSDE